MASRNRVTGRTVPLGTRPDRLDIEAWLRDYRAARNKQNTAMQPTLSLDREIAALRDRASELNSLRN